MSNKKIIFVDAARMSWALSVTHNPSALILENNYEPNGIRITAEKGQLAIDETNKLSPFVLELDDGVSVWLTDESAIQVGDFLEEHWLRTTGEAA